MRGVYIGAVLMASTRVLTAVAVVADLHNGRAFCIAALPLQRKGAYILQN